MVRAGRMPINDASTAGRFVRSSSARLRRMRLSYSCLLSARTPRSAMRVDPLHDLDQAARIGEISVMKHKVTTLGKGSS